MKILDFYTLQDYKTIFNNMRNFTKSRNLDTLDEIWLLEHLPVYTQGVAGKKQHILHTNNIPIVQSDRGGQITYHGPGQMMGYVLIDLKRLKLNVRNFITLLENTIIQLLANYNIDAYAKKDAPGVYTNNAKICSLGLRIRKGYSYHGISLNVDMDLSPFKDINPCGFKDLKVTQIIDYYPNITITQVKKDFIDLLKVALYG